MRVNKIEIRQVMGIEELEITPGKITRVTGPNGAGKSSVVAALRTVFDGGHDATLIRRGSDEAEIVLLLDDGIEITKTITRQKADIRVVKRTGDKVEEQSKPATFVKNLIDALSFNPVEFFEAKPADRIAVLLESIPIEADPQRLEEIVGPFKEALQGTAGRHALLAIDDIHEYLDEERRATERMRREKDGHVKQLRDTLPPPEQLATDWDAKAREAMAMRDKAVAERNEDAAIISAKYQAELDAVQADFHSGLTKIREQAQAAAEKKDKEIAELQRQIALLNDLRAKELLEFKDREKGLATMKEEAVRKVLDAKAAELSSLQAAQNREIEALTENLATAQEKVKRAAADRRTADMEREATKEARRLEDQVADLDLRRRKLDAYKAELCSNLPIEGLEVKDGKIFLDSIPFERVNDGKKLAKVAMKIAMLRGGKLKFIACDNVERLDAENLKALDEEIVKAGYQAILARVTDTGNGLQVRAEVA